MGGASEEGGGASGGPGRGVSSFSQFQSVSCQQSVSGERRKERQQVGDPSSRFHSAGSHMNRE